MTRLFGTFREVSPEKFGVKSRRESLVETWFTKNPEWAWGNTKSRLNENEAEFEVCQNAARNGAGCRMIGLAVRA